MVRHMAIDLTEIENVNEKIQRIFIIARAVFYDVRRKYGKNIHAEILQRTSPENGSVIHSQETGLSLLHRSYSTVGLFRL